jgi:hypothetical protein
MWNTEHVFRAKSSQEVLYEYISKELSLLFSQLNLQAKTKNKYGIFKKKKGQFIYKQYGEVAQFKHGGSLKTDISHNQWGRRVECWA